MFLIREPLGRFSVLSLVVVGLSPADLPIAAEPTKDAIAAVWKARHDGLRTARFNWTETVLIAAGTKLKRPPGDQPPEELPPNDLKFKRSVMLSLNGKMLRFSQIGSAWETSLGTLVKRLYVSTFDGETSRSFYSGDETVPRRFAVLGFDHAEARNQESNYYMLAPVLLTYRACDPDTGGRDLAKFKIGTKKATIDVHQCVILASASPSEITEELWLDPDRDFVVLRVSRSMPGKKTTLDISYDQDPKLGWIPSSWRWIAFGPDSGRIFEEHTASVTLRELNTDVPREQFQFTYPPGTLVRDARNGGYYVVTDGNGKRSVTPEDVRELRGTPADRSR
jgi:hypothetical protein